MLLKKIITPMVLAGMTLPTLNSCYFNSAGHIADAASHSARVYTEDISVGKQVYTDGDSYYIELPHYRYGKKVVTQYNALDSDSSDSEAVRTYKGMQMFEIPADYAQYLMGKTKKPVSLSYVYPVKNGDAIKRYQSYPVKVKPVADTADWEYNSPNAPWLYTACVFDWLIVDLPITLIENSLLVTGVTLAILGSGADNTSYSNTSSTTTYTADDYYRFYLNATDASTKVDYLSTAAEMGHSQAQFEYGVLNLEAADDCNDRSIRSKLFGDGILWIKRAARNGHPQAQRVLNDTGYTW